jgi:hypothetical protein
VLYCTVLVSDDVLTVAVLCRHRPTTLQQAGARVVETEGERDGVSPDSKSAKAIADANEAFFKSLEQRRSRYRSPFSQDDLE